MKKIMALLIGLLMIANISFAMQGFVDMQTFKGVHCGMSPDEVIAKWGQPIGQQDRSTYYFNPGGLRGYFDSNKSLWGTNTKNTVTYLRRIYAENNPQLVLQPSGVAIGMSGEEVERRLGKPDSIKYMDWYSDHSGMCERRYYRTPKYTNFAGLKGDQTISIWVCTDSSKPFNNQVIAMWIDGSFY